MSDEMISIQPKKGRKRGEDGYQYVSFRMRVELVQKLDAIAQQTNRSRNDVLGLILENAIDKVRIAKGDDKG